MAESEAGARAEVRRGSACRRGGDRRERGQGLGGGHRRTEAGTRDRLRAKAGAGPRHAEAEVAGTDSRGTGQERVVEAEFFFTKGRRLLWLWFAWAAAAARADKGRREEEKEKKRESKNERGIMGISLFPMIQRSYFTKRHQNRFSPTGKATFRAKTNKSRFTSEAISWVVFCCISI